jgi:hypothetical protein
MSADCRGIPVLSLLRYYVNRRKDKPLPVSDSSFDWVLMLRTCWLHRDATI